MLPSLLPLLVCLGAAVLLPQHRDLRTRPEHINDYKYVRRGDEPGNKTFCSWKCLMFTLLWPGAFCMSLNKVEDCRLPQDINTWTIHGLWPQRAQYCCSCWNMFPSDVQELATELSMWWPSFVKSKTYVQFWRQEWQKHGVCAACVEGIHSPLLYFQLCLKLRAQFDIQRILDEASVSPSCIQPYKLAELQAVLDPFFGNHYEIQCITDEQDREVWFQVKIPISRNLTLGCVHRDHLQEERGLDMEHKPGQTASDGHPCPAWAPIYLVPIDHLRPAQPCG